jgi:adenylate kinase family enzyme
VLFCASVATNFGEVAEWSKAPVSKTGIPQGIEGSNPSLSADINMKKAILITGVAGAGKSTVSAKLRELGYVSHEIETIPGLFRTVDKDSDEPFECFDEQDAEHVKKAKWICDESVLKEMITNEKSDLSFYCGTSSNIQKLLHLFTMTIVLSASPTNTRNRLTHRTSHDFGKSRDVQDWLLSWKDDWELFMKEKGAILISSDAPLIEVTEEILKIAS